MIDVDVGGGDFIFLAALSLVEVPVEGAGGNAADGGDSAGEPEFVAVLGVGGLFGVAVVDVGVDEAREKIYAGAVDLAGALGRAAAFAHGKVRGFVFGLGYPGGIHWVRR